MNSDICICGAPKSEHNHKGQRFEYRKRFAWSNSADVLYTLVCAQLRLAK